MPVYIATTQGNQAWVDYMEGKYTSAEENGNKTLAVVKQIPTLAFISCWPLMAIALNREDVSQAVEMAKLILNPAVRACRPAVDASLQAGVRSFEAGDIPHAKEHLEQAVRLSLESGHF